MFNVPQVVGDTRKNITVLKIDLNGYQLYTEWKLNSTDYRTHLL